MVQSRAQTDNVSEPSMTTVEQILDQQEPSREPQIGNDAPAVRGRHLPGLDGLRGIAIGTVVFYHLRAYLLTGGFLGVDLFFVLSGFLITSLLIEERDANGSIRLLSFWVRRAKRLLPALFTMLGVLTAIIVIHAWANLGSPSTTYSPFLFRGDALASIFFVINWHEVAIVNAHQIGVAPHLLWHLWSLAVEEQFYLVWPLVTVGVFLLPKPIRRWVGLGLSVLAALASSLFMTHLFDQGQDVTRAYVGTDTRAFALLLGAALAWIVSSRPQPGPIARKILCVAGPLAAIAMVPFFLHGGTLTFLFLASRFMFHGGFFLFALLAVLVVADVRQVNPSPLARCLSIRPLRYLGAISYALYLFHLPIKFMIDSAHLPINGWWSDLIVVILSIGCAELSSRFLELPIRRSKWVDRHLWSVPLSFATISLVVIVGTSSFVLLATAASGSSSTPPTSQPVAESLSGVDLCGAAKSAGRGHHSSVSESDFEASSSLELWPSRRFSSE